MRKPKWRVPMLPVNEQNGGADPSRESFPRCKSECLKVLSKYVSLEVYRKLG
jgi:hypothetical protein